jgi:hypothetical protein
LRLAALTTHQSSNFFAALDDSGDEAPVKKPPAAPAAAATGAVKGKDSKPKAPSGKKVVVEPSRIDETYVPMISCAAVSRP